MKEFLEEYFQLKGIEYKQSNEQFILRICPFCGDDKFHHFYMSMEEGLWDCKKCGSKGNYNQFREVFGDNALEIGGTLLPQSKQSPNTNGTITTLKPKKTYTELKFDLPIQQASRLWAVDIKFLDYLKNTRKLSETVIKQFKIGSTGDAISIPIYEEGKLVNIRYRRDPSKDNDEEAGARYSQEKGAKTALFNGDILSSGIKQVYIVEGEFDAMQLIDRGITNVVSTTLGASSFPKDWVPKFDDIKQIYLVYDTDEEGRSGMKKAAEKLGIDKCKLVYLPEKSGRKKTDITNYFVEDGHTKSEFLELVKNSKHISIVSDDAIKHISDFNEQLRNLLIKGEHLGVSTGYQQLDEVMGGLRKGRLVVLAGLTNSGKSSFAVNVGLNMAVNGASIFYLSLEMPPIDIAKKFLMLKAKLTTSELKVVEDPSPVLTTIDKTLLEFKGSATEQALPIYLYNGSGMVKYKVLEDCAKMAKEKYNCQAIFVDHLHYFATNFGNLAAETSQVVRSIKQLAISLEMPIVLLAHLNRGGRTKNRKGLYTPSLADLKETSTIEQDADQVLFICRDSESSDPKEREKSFVKVAKNRDGQAGRSVNLSFNEQITSFIEEQSGKPNYEEQAKQEQAELAATINPDDLQDLPF